MLTQRKNMKQENTIRIKQFGNVLQITVEIPWQQVNGQNQWQEYFEENPVKQTPNYWAITTEKILKLYKKHGNISATAKASGKSYYITEKILKEEKSRPKQGQASNRDRGSPQTSRQQNQHQRHCPDHRKVA
jgi:hypothetical protein